MNGALAGHARRPARRDVARSVDGFHGEAGRGRLARASGSWPNAKARPGPGRVKLGSGTDVSKTLTGNLDTFSLADLLQWLEINALSGRVTLRRGDVVRTIDLKEGAIVFVSSSRPGERLGVFLAKRLILPEKAVYELLAESFATGRNLTRLILERKLLSREKLREAVESLAIEILLDLFRWTNASFDFDPLFKIEDLIRIHLSLRGQVLAFHGVKSPRRDVAGASRARPPRTRRAPSGSASSSPRPSRPTFWSISSTASPGEAPSLARSGTASPPSRVSPGRSTRASASRRASIPLYDDVGDSPPDGARRRRGPGAARPDRGARPVLHDEPPLPRERAPAGPAERHRLGAPRPPPRRARRAPPPREPPRRPGDAQGRRPANGWSTLIRRTALSTAVAASHLAPTQETLARGGLYAGPRRAARELRAPQAADLHVPFPPGPDARGARWDASGPSSDASWPGS